MTTDKQTAAQNAYLTNGPWDIEADVVVAGLGAAGCAAAIEAHDNGAHVIVLEKMAAGRAGGNTRVSGGVWFDNADPNRAAVYLRSLCGEYTVPDAVVDVWATETQRNTAWLRALGADVAPIGDFRPEYPELEGSDAYGGYLGIGGRMGDGLLFGVLSEAVHARGIDVRLETPARELVQDPASGRIVGAVAVRADGTSLRVGARRGVVLATGGFEADQQMVRDYLRLPRSVIWGTPAATGDGHRMAQKVGADLWHMDNMMTITGLRAPDHDSGFYISFLYRQGFVYVGLDGSRLGNELPQVGHGQARLHGAYELFPTAPMHVVFDEATRRAGPISPGRDALAVGWNLLLEGYQWSPDNSVEIEKGWIHQADTLPELAALIGVDPANLEGTVHRYNAACAAGVDDQFGRDPKTLAPLAEPPYYALSRATMLGWSNGGPRRNEKAEVLDPFGAVIPGLYAAGNISSTYSWCKDGGMHIADALAFGRVAGRTAAG